MSQNDKILAHLKTGKTINPQQALKKFGCMRLASRINNLKHKGHKIKSVMVYKGNVKYAMYMLEGE